jgi:hypothetical protein
MKRKRLGTVQAVVAVLGGTLEVARITGVRYGAAFNWLSQGYFPAWTYLLITNALARHRLVASPDLWPQMARRDECA